jgi:SMI1 / KNR4 family (SUKH-1)/6-bladed beta-propeller
MTLAEMVRNAHDSPASTADGRPIQLHLGSPLSPTEMEVFAARLPCALPHEVRELLELCRGIEGSPLATIDFTGQTLPFEYPEVFPHGLPIAADGYGNFWVIDLMPRRTEWGPVYFASHDPPVILYQSDSLSAFLTEVFKLLVPPYESLIDDVHDDRLFQIWGTNPGVRDYQSCMASSDRLIADFAADLGPAYEIVDLRNAPIGFGFSWGRYGPKTVVRRAGDQAVFAYKKNVSWVRRLFGGGRAVFLSIILVAGLVGCTGRESRSLGTAWQAQRDTIGDTIVVQTVSGSVWGPSELVAELRIGAVEGADHEVFGDIGAISVSPSSHIYVLDRQVPALREYGPDGEYIRTLGRRGRGPGEYLEPDGGLAVLTDGRVVLRDPGNVRLTVYGTDGEYVVSWQALGSTHSSMPMVAMPDGGLVTPAANFGGSARLVRYAPNGAAIDTLDLPSRDVEPGFVRAQVVGASMTYRVPFTSSAVWAWHPGGYFVSAVTGRYAVDLLRGPRPGDVLRLARSVDPISVPDDERAAEEERITAIMRNLDPSWRWNGPRIPDTKPTIRSLYVGDDGRIWVLRHQRGDKVDHPDADPSEPSFLEPTVFDVFEPDGRYLGPVNAPAAFSVTPRPVFRGENVWATERDQLGVQYVGKYRIAHAGS